MDVTAIDISREVIKIAKQNAKAKNVKCTFLVADVTENLPHFDKPFEFIYDWGLLHHVPPEKRTAYTQNVHRILTAKGLKGKPSPTPSILPSAKNTDI